MQQTDQIFDLPSVVAMDGWVGYLESSFVYSNFPCLLHLT